LKLSGFEEFLIENLLFLDPLKRVSDSSEPGGGEELHSNSSTSEGITRTRDRKNAITFFDLFIRGYLDGAATGNPFRDPNAPVLSMFPHDAGVGRCTSPASNPRGFR
jgi:hypothetical protein